MKMRRSEISRILAGNVENALSRYRAVRSGALIEKSGNSGQRARGQASTRAERGSRLTMAHWQQRQSAAILALSEALQRHSEFVLDGKIPSDLQG